jgi:hypothetical protein
MVAQLFWVFAMILCLQVALDVSTREVLSLAISDSPTHSGACAVLHKLAIPGVPPTGSSSSVDRSRLDVWVEPDTA